MLREVNLFSQGGRANNKSEHVNLAFSRPMQLLLYNPFS